MSTASSPDPRRRDAECGDETRERTAALALAALVRESDDLRVASRLVGAYLQAWLPCELVQVRLPGDDGPRFACTDASQVGRCAWNQVLREPADDAPPSSCWRGAASEPARCGAEAAPAAPVCCDCLGQDCESLALVPLAAAHGSPGWLHAADRQAGRLDAAVVEQLERLGQVLVRATEQRAAQPRAEAGWELADGTPAGVWEHDCSAVRPLLERLGLTHVVDLSGHFDRHPEQVTACLASVRSGSADRACLELLDRPGDATRAGQLTGYLVADSRPVFCEAVCLLARGAREVSRELVLRSAQGALKLVRVALTPAASGEVPLAQVRVGLADRGAQLRAAPCEPVPLAPTDAPASVLPGESREFDSGAESPADGPAPRPFDGLFEPAGPSGPTLLERLNRDLLAHRECSRALARATDEQGLIDEVCRILCEVAGYRLVWVGLALDDPGCTVRVAGWAGCDAGYARSLRVSYADEPHGRGPVGEAIRGAAACCIDDLAADPRMLPWRDEALARGLRSVLALPLRGHDRPPLGSLACYADEPGAFTAEERELLQHLADDLAFGLVGLRAQVARRRAERDLRESEQLYHSLVRTLPQLVVRKDLAGAYVFANQRFCEYVGQPLHQVLGATDRQLFGPDAAAALAAHEARVATERTGRELTAEVAYPAAGRRLMQAALVPLADAHGQPHGLQAIFTDLTDQHSLREQLRHAQRLESIGRLAGGVAHDLNNLLQPILGYADMLRNRLQDEEARADLDEIVTAGLRGRELTRQLLAFGRGQTLDLATVELGEVARRFLRLLRRTLREDVELELLVAPDTCPVRADVGQVEQVLMNLLVNAQDAMPEGGRVTIAIAEAWLEPDEAQALGDLPPGRYGRLDVSDTGCGLDAETQARVFEPFFTTKRPGEGTGLGLSVVYGIVRQHGGGVSLRSAPGEGCQFSIYLPASADAVLPPATPDWGGRPGPSGRETILVVDDDARVLELTGRLLASRGYQVLAAESGEAALELLDGESAEVDLLLTDVGLPGLSGPELFARLAPRWPALSVVYISGHPDEVIAWRGLAPTADERLLYKPFEGQVLLQAVRDALDTRRGKHVAAQP